ncbi:PREDICTED: uncharacterized protein LOC109242173 [Nicotiana attenuata]|uniref:uncharacterized protein LOC109242173 n=1 Tax=Nicotiana attenuata TaxID=49451 RepID=UPI0009054938|nr:PREDICTED: uncharacterized protein LOC109242173 [Nicotiana attenuata]
MCADGVIRRGVPDGEMASILSHCHDGAAGGHYGGNRTAEKVMEAGFYCPTLYKDARAYVAVCDKCQRASDISKRDEMPHNSIPWVKAIPTWTSDARVVCEFLRKNIFKGFGTSRVIISDNGSHFVNKRFAALLSKYGVKHKTGTPYHAQTSGQVEVANRELKQILEKMVSASRKEWSEMLEEALWTCKTAFKTTIGTSLFKLCEHRLAQMNALEQFRLDAYENVRIFKEKTKRWNDRLIKPKEFHEGDRVLLYNSRLRLFPRKFKSRWTGPYVVKHVSPYGAIKIQNMDETESFKVHWHRLKPYLAGGFAQQSSSIKIS